MENKENKLHFLKEQNISKLLQERVKHLVNFNIDIVNREDKLWRISYEEFDGEILIM